MLQTLNPDVTSPDTIYVGQILAIPDNATPVSSGPRVTHTVQPGESLGEIAARYGVTVEAVLALNPQQAPDLLWAGTELVIRDDFAPAVVPTNTPTDAPTNTAPPLPLPSIPSTDALVPYLVQPGDTYSGLSQRFDTTAAHLFALNPSLPPDRLWLGATIVVPFAGGGLGLPAPDPATPDGTGDTAPSGFDYVVAPGDTASDIAARYGLTLARLQAANDGALSTVFVGQTLRIPALAPSINTAPTPDAPSSGSLGELTDYLVQPGDNATQIAVAHEITLDDLAALNPTVDVTLLLIGQTLTVPRMDLPSPPAGSVPAGPPRGARYTVVSGDTFTAIAERFGLATDELRQLNPGIEPNLIVIDQQIRLPGTEPLPIVSLTTTVGVGDLLPYVAARLGALPHTLLANNPALGTWIPAGTTIVVPDREGLLVTVLPGDTLLGIAQRYGSSVDAIIADSANGVADPNHLILGQELIVPITVPPFIFPIDGLLTDGFGVCRLIDCSVRHQGADIADEWGTPVLAIADGTVTFAGGDACCGLGFYVEIEHANGFRSVAAHLNGPPPLVEDQLVRQGDVIGHVGTTGYSTGPHVHLELHHNDWALDPLNYLR